MTKTNTTRNRVLLIILLLAYPIICKFSFDILQGFYDDFQLTFAFWGKYLNVFVMVLYAIAGQYLIKRIIQEKWKVGVVITFVILIVYVFVLALLPVPIPELSSFISLLSRLEYNFVPTLLLVYTIIYLIYDRKKNI